jgi:hypothetical protein
MYGTIIIIYIGKNNENESKFNLLLVFQFFTYCITGKNFQKLKQWLFYFFIFQQLL